MRIYMIDAKDRHEMNLMFSPPTGLSYEKWLSYVHVYLEIYAVIREFSMENFVGPSEKVTISSYRAGMSPEKFASLVTPHKD